MSLLLVQGRIATSKSSVPRRKDTAGLETYARESAASDV
jgi:hypothetical protein